MTKKLMMALMLMPMMALATTWYVNGSSGSDYNSGTSESSAKATIQAAIDASSAGDMILVAPGTYNERLEITKRVELKAISGPQNTTIHGQSGYAVVRIMEDASGTVVDGFEITGGTGEPNPSSYGYDYYGGGVRCRTSVTVRNCIIHGNGHGTPRTNSGTFGGGISSISGNVLVENCLFYDNFAWACGGGTFVESDDGEMTLSNCTIYDNDSTDFFGYQGGVGLANGATVRVKNCIVWGNGGSQIDAYSWPYNSGTTAEVSYSCVQGGVTKENAATLNCGAGNVSTNPGFVDAANGNYRLAAGSPCIDAGNNAYVTGDKDLAGNARIANGTVDIGCYEYGSSVTQTPTLPADITLPDGLWAYYPLDGNANDVSGNGNDLTAVQNEPQPTTDRFGNVNGAYEFNGNSAQSMDIYAENDAGLQSSSVIGTFSFAFWFQTNSSYKDYGAGWAWNLGNYAVFPSHGGFYNDERGQASGLGVKVGVDGIELVEHADFYMPTKLTYQADIGNGWHHVAVTVEDSGCPRLYLDGVYVATGETSDRTRLFRPNVGGWQWGYYTGKVDDLMVYNRALSAAEVKALYDGTAVPPTPPANGLWTVTQYNLNVQPYSASDAEAYIADSTKWDGQPVTKTYDRISFEDGLYQASTHFDSVSFPGNENGKHNYFAVSVNGVINIPEAGYWTFATGVDDGFRVVLAGSETYSFEYNGENSFQTIVRAFYVETPGSYMLRAIYYETGGEAAFDLSVAKGSYSYFDSSAFKLVGDPASGVTLAGSGEYHTVTFDLNGAYGDAPAERQVVEGAVIGTLPTPEREGYEFLGWHRGKEASSEEVTASTVVTNDLIVYAVWKVAEYTVTFDLNGADGAAPTKREIAYGETIGALPTVVRTGYTFLGWFTAASGGAQVTADTTVTADATCYAHWAINQYTVTFNANGGNVSSTTRMVASGAAVGTLPTPTRSGYAFVGWWTAASGGTQITSATKVTANVTYYAHWGADGSTMKCTVTFDVNGHGALRNEEVTRKVAKGMSVGELPTPMVPNLAGSGFGRFQGWFTARTGGTQILAATVVTEDVTYYAHWKYFRYIVLDANGGEFSADYDDWWPFVENGATIGSLPAVSRSGYTLDGWFTAASGGTRVSADTKITATVSNIGDPLKYYAHWTKVSFPGVTTWKFYEEADDDEGLNLAAWEEWNETDVAFWIGEGISMAIPVYDGNFTADDVALVSGTYSDYGRPRVVSDDWMFAKHYTALKKAVGYDPYEDDEYDQGAYGPVFEDDVKGRNYSLSMDIWRQKKAVSGRKWILLEMGGRPTKGCKTFYLGVKGRDEIGYSRFRIYATPDQGVSQTPSNWSSQRELAVLPMPIGSGTTSGSGVYASGTYVSLSAKPNAGYAFEGWYDQTSGQMIGSSMNLSFVTTGANKTIFAKFRENIGSVVTFNANGGVVKESSRIVTIGNTVGTLPTPIRENHKFVGWFTAMEGGTRVTASVKVTANVTYYAHWTLIVTPEPTPTPAPESVFAGTLDDAFAKAQTVDGALYKGDALVGTVQMKVGKINKKGVVKVSATATLLVDGKVKKVTAKAVNVNVGETAKLVFKAPIGSMTFTMAAVGTFTLKNGSYLMAEAKIGGAINGGGNGTFGMEGFNLSVPGILLDELLPDGEPVEVSRGKWKFAKAATVKWAKPKKGAEHSDYYDDASGKDLIVDDTKGKTNLSGLKLTYTAKTGQFKGSFKVYALQGTDKKKKLAKYTVNVIGFVVDGVGYGQATCKKPAGTWAVTVE